MQKRIQIGLVGDFDEKMYTHIALRESIDHCRPHLHFALETSWIATEDISETFLATSNFDGFWIIPGSPYVNDDGVYSLIRWCRENDFPLFGTCGGFQYMLIEYARNVLKFAQAGHEESEPGKEHLIITKLNCSLAKRTAEVIITDRESWLFHTLKTDRITGHYNCSYGLNKVYEKILDQYPLRFTALSNEDPHAFELKSHRFHAATLFQPTLDSTPERPNPLVLSFLNKCALP
jgi:CTP synthase (UTP-ammonia lyase)